MLAISGRRYYGSVMVERLRAQNSNSGVSDQQNMGLNPSVVTLVSLSKTLNHCCILRMGRKTVGPMCCVTHVKEHSALIAKRRGSPRCSWLWLLYAPYSTL